MGFTPYKPPWGTELQEKEVQKDQSIQEICLEKVADKKYLLILDLVI